MAIGSVFATLGGGDPPESEDAMTALATDYLVIGSGAMGMAFADEILTHHPSDRVLLVDRHAQPGGHWNDAYGFVLLHQPAAFYGVNSQSLGPGGAALASGNEVLAYYERVLGRLRATGRLDYFPMCEFHGEGRFSSNLDTTRSYRVEVRKKTVDATYMKVQVPSRVPPRYAVAAGTRVVPPNALAALGQPAPRYVIIGAGKTGIDAALFLLDRGVAPDRITWIMSRDPWLLNRGTLHPRLALEALFFDLVESLARAKTTDDVFRELEARGFVMRLDPGVWPTKFRCATVNETELEQLRRIENVVRLGRVKRVEPAGIELEGGSLPIEAGTVHVDCSADGLAKREIRPVFDGAKITLQSLFMCQQVFSAAVIGYLEARGGEDAEQNELCRVVPHPEVPRDFVAAMQVTAANLERWSRAMARWLRQSRLSLVHHAPWHRLVWNQLRARRQLPVAQQRMRAILEPASPAGAPRAAEPSRGPAAPAAPSRSRGRSPP